MRKRFWWSLGLILAVSLTACVDEMPEERDEGGQETAAAALEETQVAQEQEEVAPEQLPEGALMPPIDPLQERLASARPALLDENPALKLADIRARQANADALYEMIAEDKALVARNPQRKILTRFEGERAEISALNQEDWSLSLSFAGIGREGQASQRPALIERSHQANKLQLEREALNEWYLNGPLGLQQGFDVAAAPKGTGQVEIRVEVSGGLLPQLDGSLVRLVDPAGASQAIYRDLLVEDAKGKILTSELQVEGQEIVLAFDDSQAVYPVVVDPLVVGSEEKIYRDGETDNIEYGFSVAIDGNLAAVGAYYASAGGYNGSGAVYIYLRSAGVWTLETVLNHPSPEVYQYFGRAVDLSDDTLLVGANGASDGLGEAIVFVRSGSTWSHQATLTASGGTTSDNFAEAVSLDGDRALVGADYDNSIGAVYVFARAGSTWSHEAKLIPSDTTVGQRFGRSVSLSGERALIGAAYLNSQEGAAYVFTLNEGVWSEEAKLTPPSSGASQYFGFSVALYQDQLIIGAIGVSDFQGAVYFYSRSGSTWSLDNEIICTTCNQSDYLGYTVGMSQGLGIGGAINGNFVNLYYPTATGWEYGETLIPSDAGSYDNFSRSISADEQGMLVSAPYHNSYAGAVYYYQHITGIYDDSGAIGTNDGTVNTDEYPGDVIGNENTGFGGTLGMGKIYIDSDTDLDAEGNLLFGFERGTDLFNDSIVIYIDAVTGGLADTTSLTDEGDDSRRAISGHSSSGHTTITFPAGFEADYAIVWRYDYAGLFSLSTGTITWVKNLSLGATPGNAASSYEFSGLTLADLGLVIGDDFDFVASYINGSTGFRADEAVGIGVASGNPGYDGDITFSASAVFDAADLGDADGDGLWDVIDNCPAVANADQTDTDGDDIGDACDSCVNDADNDADGDGLCGDVDNCPATANSDQNDADEDGAGDACDSCVFDPYNDADGDGVCGDVDNCPATANSDQNDADEDSLGDACDSCPFDADNDADGDGLCGDVDNCPATANSDQNDADEDSLGDACDSCVFDADNDADGDGVCGDVDNCPATANSDQNDADEDSLGDACDSCVFDPYDDADGDGVCGDVDNCPATANSDQNDADEDGQGDVCDSCVFDPYNDADGDGVCGDVDNCPATANSDQNDADEDSLGDACDSCVFDADNDADGDGVCGDVDNCPADSNPAQADADEDGLGDVCDSCVFDADNDADGDGVCGDVDNCPATANSDQNDADEDSLGDACDGCVFDADNDADNDGVCGDVDNCPATANSDQNDADEDSLGDACDSCVFDADNDADGDGVCADVDNCPATANSDQNDADEDSLGDACDSCVFDADNDADGDGVCGDVDNCPADSNPAQADADEDGLGDVCDSCVFDADNDADGDGVCGDVDNCPATANSDQNDADEDSLGDACDGCVFDADNDADGDGVCGDVDNCPATANSDQNDADEDSLGDACDSCVFDADNDADGDGVCGDVDNCPADSNPAQADADEDGLGNACDSCINDPDNDADGDGVCGNLDNCPSSANADQSDVDEDGLGDACDSCANDADNDADGDGVCGDVDNCPATENTDQSDLDEDGLGDACDSCANDADNDADGDGVCGDVDNCPATTNTDQSDLDEDGLGDACDSCANDADNDADSDGVCGDVDNCPATENTDQSDVDEDGLGDACDSCANDADNDADSDGVCGDVDNCPATTNTDQSDVDEDGLGDACDSCANDADNDADSDGVCGNVDNCPATTNTDQSDVDEDGLGDACDSCANDADNDADSDGVCGDVDNCPATTNTDQSDVDEDGLGDACDSCADDADNDADSDGVCGDVDNCPATTNTDQSDVDEDGLGDACDSCVNDADNDADSDGVCGDVDNCPATANTNQDDADEDGLGDACDPLPEAAADGYTVNEDTTLTGNVLDNDSDADDATLTAVLVDEVQHGELTFNADGSFSYTPEAEFSGSDAFTYQAFDATHYSDTTSVSIVVEAVNDVPVALAQAVAIEKGIPLNITLEGTDIEDQSLSFAIAVEPEFGTISDFDGASGALVYTSFDDYSGQDFFTFTVSDGEDTSAPARVDISISAPLAIAASHSTEEDTALEITLSATASWDGVLSYEIVEAPAFGQIIDFDNRAGTLTYTPNADFNGEDAFAFRVLEDGVPSNQAQISLTVTPVNDAPILVEPTPVDPMIATEGVELSFTIAATDIDLDTLAYSIEEEVEGLQVDASTGEVSWTPTVEQAGEWTFTLVASDGELSAERELDLMVDFIDIDFDGVPDTYEEELGLDNETADSDGDGILDIDEIGDDPTNPSDTDGDGTIDALDDDADGDGIPDSVEVGDDDLDTPPADTDEDGTPDYLDSDSDDDEVDDLTDNCPLVANDDQTDTDEDGVGDACTDDADGDEVLDDDDNCPLVANGEQEDNDGDGQGDACDADDDDDEVRDDQDNCPMLANPEQLDTDLDGLGDACDEDDDDDEVADDMDNCPLVANPEQTDTDYDGLGDGCDDDSDDDGVLDEDDECPLEYAETEDGCPEVVVVDEVVDEDLLEEDPAEFEDFNAEFELEGESSGGDCGCSQVSNRSTPLGIWLFGAILGFVALMRRRRD